MNVDSIETLKLIPTSVDVAFSINRAIADKLPHFVDLAPFRSAYDITVGIVGELYVYRIEDTSGRSQTNGRGLSTEERAFLTSIEDEMTAARGRELYALLGPAWVGRNKFTYVGRADLCHELRQHLEPQLLNWTNSVLLPTLVQINLQKGRVFPPKTLQLDRAGILSALWVLESEAESKQGTAFMLSGTGLISAAHTLATDTVAFRATDLHIRKRVRVRRKNDIIDLAILDVDGPAPDASLRPAVSDETQVLDAVAIAGFPNYRYGDSGTIMTGTVAGYRMNSGIRRVIVDASIIAGNSGGPVLNAVGEVIGVAVTGADRAETVNQTEDHSFIPITALDLL